MALNKYVVYTVFRFAVTEQLIRPWKKELEKMNVTNSFC